jgi:hypothetical protein
MLDLHDFSPFIKEKFVSELLSVCLCVSLALELLDECYYIDI